MAELNLSTGKTGGRSALKRMHVRVDLTAMVDLAFLLITFFMLTTSLTKPKAMDVVMPADGPPGDVFETSTMSICLGAKNKAVFYLGIPGKPLTEPKLSGYGQEIRKAIVDMSKQVYASTGRPMMVLIKPGEHSRYSDLVDALDEMNINKIQSYAIAKITPEDVTTLKQKGIY
ncbi:MAG: biopolymer transporter ExbD [Bacteroidota bacterium]